ncbi:MAG: S41 family peptidase [Planctomycetota bacterium]
MTRSTLSALLFPLLAACGATVSASGTALAVLPVQAGQAAAAAQPGAERVPGMLRSPDVSATHVAFAYADDLWLVPREGGLATPLSSPAGSEVVPRFSPDGREILFSGNYDGGRDLFVLPVSGGVARRLTHHPGVEQVCDWTPDGRVLFASAHESPLASRGVAQIFTMGAQGGLPQRLPVPYGGNAALSADGDWLAYVPVPFDARTWKRYEGGTAMDVWLFNLRTLESRRMTDWKGTDTYPMWHGRSVYYLSDAGSNHHLNVWVYELDSGRRRQVTDFGEFDVRWPAIGPGDNGGGEIVFQHGSALHLLDLRTQQTRVLNVTVPGDRPELAARAVDVSKAAGGWALSPSGKRALVEARGDIWTLPAEHGAPRNLTASDNASDRSPAWSPDGQWVAYSSDRDGEYELHLIASDGSAKGARQLTDGHQAFFSRLLWSPDSKRLAFQDQSAQLYVHELESQQTVSVDRDPWARPMHVSWSHDSTWLAYNKAADSLPSLWLWDAEARTSQRLTAGVFADNWPTFDREGKYLFLASTREWSEPRYGDLDTTFVYAATDRLLVVPLRADVPSPFLPKSDEELRGEEKTKAKAEEQAKTEPEADAEAPPKERLRIDVEGFERRAVLLPVGRGNFSDLAVTHSGQLVYARRPAPGLDGPASVHFFDLEDDERKEKSLADKANALALSADGKILLVAHEGQATLREAKPDAKAKPVVTAGMRVLVDPRDEWRAMFVDAWRRYREWFYDPQMHGVDWVSMRTSYGALLEDCVSRGDVGYVIRELISELNVGHAYYNGGPDEGEAQPNVPVGLLACDFSLEQGAFRIAAIHEGAPWDADARGPLSQPGVTAKVGDFLLAVDGVPLNTERDPWQAFVGKADQVVALTLSDRPQLDESARRVLVKPLANDGALRYRAWVESRRLRVEQASGGRVGYLHVPDTGVNGQNNLFRQFAGQIHKEALIVDERWNGGGQVPTRFIELLARPVTNLWAIRDSKSLVWPPDSHQGPKCMLINQRAGSGGDAFPYYFRQAGLGPLIGVRTWGGLIGIDNLPPLLDGASVSVPNFAFYENDGTWGVEGYGVDPDVEVIEDPARMQHGEDPQLDKAIELMLAALQRGEGYRPLPVPAFPDRSGFGVTEQDR